MLGIGQPDLYDAGSRGVLVHFCVPPTGLKGQLGGSPHLASAKGKSERGDAGAAPPEDPISLVLSDR